MNTFKLVFFAAQPPDGQKSRYKKTTGDMRNFKLKTQCGKQQAEIHFYLYSPEFEE